MHDLVEEYGRLRRLEGHSPQTRGQRFNSFIADLLQCLGVPARSNVTGSGEVDVAFTLDGVRFVVEAKWEVSPADTGHIAKLQKRLRQRLAGTVGVFLSMSGYSDAALRDLKEGEQLTVVLLDGDHVEALLTGVVSVEELFSVVVDRASYSGTPHTSLIKLLARPTLTPDTSFTAPTSVPDLVRSNIEGFEATVVASDLPFGQSGVAELEPEVILITTVSGLLELNLNTRTARYRVPIPNCARNSLIGPDGSIYFVRRSGVLRVQADRLQVIAGGWAGNVGLLTVDGAPWAFASGIDGPGVPARPPVLVSLSERPGEESTHSFMFPPAFTTNVAHIEATSFLVIGQGRAAVVDLEGGTEPVDYVAANPMGLMKTGPNRYLTAANDVDLIEIDTSARTSRIVSSLNLAGAVSELAHSPNGGGYLLSHYSNERRQTRGIVVRVRY